LEELVEGLTGGAAWGVGFGLAMRLLGGLGQGLRPAVKNAVRGGIVAQDWLRSATAEARETLQDIYEEARAESKAPEVPEAEAKKA
jgi:hypothetical protein